MDHRPSKQAMVDASLVLQTPAQPHISIIRPAGDIVIEGWALKKRRKKLQGYARRYFYLGQSGLLCYAFEPGKAIRDQLNLHRAAISWAAGRRDIHVDSGTATFHMKCLTRGDFDRWMTAFRKFIVPESDRPLSRRSSIAVIVNHTHHAITVLKDMDTTIQDLTVAFVNIDPEDPRNNIEGQLGQKRDRFERNKSHEGSSVFSIFKRSHRVTSGASSKSQSSSHDDSILSARDHILTLLDDLRQQHAVLKVTLADLSLPLPHVSSMPQSFSLPSIADEEPPAKPNNNSISRRSGSTSHRNSLATIMSVTDASIWYDASDGEGAEEYVLAPDPEVLEDEDEVTRILESNSESTISQAEESEVTEDGRSSLPETSMSETIETEVTRRTTLPTKPTHDEGSLLSVLRKNVGQDLSNIVLPVTFNEPLTLLQRSAEEMEYHSLLDKAVETTDWMERLSYVAAFAVSGYASTKHRTGLKGFTPLLGETYEDVRTQFIAEKVVHKPLVIAYHAEGSGWELNATLSGKTKFWGKSFEIIPQGQNQVVIDDDVFEWNKPSSFTRNLVMGKKYLEHCGEMVVENKSTGARCILDFKETGYWASTPNMVSGSIFSPDDEEMSRLEGKWDEQLSQKLDQNHLHVLWRMTPFPRNAPEYYGYSYFGITLNEVTDDMKDRLPPTDSRWRRDVRALEEGDIEAAEAEKARLENLQRVRRQEGKDVKPKWFRRVDGSEQWTYVGGYWEDRNSKWQKTQHNKLW